LWGFGKTSFPLRGERRIAMGNEDDILKLLGKVSDLINKVPGAQEVYDQIRSGEISTEEAIPHLFSLLSQAGVVKEVAREGDRLTSLLSPDSLKGAGRPVHMETSTGIPQLNPLYEAALAERASLDGDIPELRSGPMPEGATPSVPVITDSMDPIRVGLMLKRASREVQGEYSAALESHKEECALVKSGGQQLPVPTGIPGYEAGNLPSLREVEASPTEAALLSPEEQRECVYLSVATTQGRRSLAPVIERGVQEELLRRGLDVKLGGRGEPFQTLYWVVQAFGPEDISEGFNPIVSAVAALAQEASCCKESVFDMAVERFDGIAARKFGWTLHLYRRENEL
jgi:hypothetical protein